MRPTQRSLSRVYGKTEDRDPTLSMGLRGDRHVRALCRCGVAVALDTSPWTEEAESPLARFEDRVRCALCGARSVPLQIWYGPATPKPQTVIYIFR